MSNSIIFSALDETVWRYSKTIAPGYFPNRYHEGRQVKEIDLVFHFVNSLEAQCSTPISYREFSSDGPRIDAIVVSSDSIFLIEAKGTLEITQGLARLEDQAKVLEDSSHSLRFYLLDNIVHPFSGEEWGNRNIEHLWGIVLADTFQRSFVDVWIELDTRQFPVLSSYERATDECTRFRKGNAQWFILSGYKHLASRETFVYSGEKKFAETQA